jgi:hypothetical protein
MTWLQRLLRLKQPKMLQYTPRIGQPVFFQRTPPWFQRETAFVFDITTDAIEVQVTNIDGNDIIVHFNNEDDDDREDLDDQGFTREAWEF